MDKNFWRLYWTQHRMSLLFLVIFLGIFALSFWLYHLPLAAVLYPAALSLLAGAALFAWDVRAVFTKEKAIEGLASLPAALVELPAAESVEESAYRSVALAMQREAAAREQEASGRYRDMVEYYTVWAHQIKTPITAMSLALQKEDSPLSRKLSGELFRIDQYVNMVMASIRLDGPHSDYVFQSCDLDAIVRATVARLASQFIGRPVKLLYEPLQYTAVTDEKWLSLVIEQILTNALKYTNQGHIRIYMPAPGVLAVEDTGIGIAPQDLPRVFEKGFTGYNGRQEGQEGRASGIGLYLAKRICGNLGVDIQVRSAVGRGTTVTLDLNQYRLQAE